MVLDSSALIAILTDERTADNLLASIGADPVRLVSAGSVLEVSLVVMGRYGIAAEPLVDRLLRDLRATVVAFDEEQLAIARDAGARFGRGRRGAALNFGDCFAYALAIARSEPLLFVGDDFALTDVARVL
ncbi:MAG: type II toxin-antitoxin system VapC family toxin [Gemmatimonadaceae bacterium]